jgi:hypothetical protein
MIDIHSQISKVNGPNATTAIRRSSEWLVSPHQATNASVPAQIKALIASITF